MTPTIDPADLPTTPIPAKWRPIARLSGVRVRPDPSEATETAATAKTPTIWRDVMLVVLLFVAWRGALFTVDYFGRMITTPITRPGGGASTGFWPGHPFWDGYLRWDSLHFLRIVKDGYTVETAGPFKGMSTDAAFLPFYPFAVKALGHLRVPGFGKVFTSVWPPGLILSNLCLIGAMYYILRIARMYLDEDGARRSVVYLLAFPTSFFLSSFYSEAMFLLTTSASFYHFLKGNHARCGVWGFLAATTRSPGIVLLPAFVIGHLWERRGKIDRSDLSMLWVGLVPCGLMTVMAYYAWKLGDPFAFSKAHSAWGRNYVWPHQTIIDTFNRINWSLPIDFFAGNILLLDLITAFAFLTLPFLLLKGYHKSLSIYAMLMILMPLSTGITMSLQRVVLVIFPAYLALAKFGKNREIDRLIVFGFALGLGVYKLAFSNGHPIL